MRHVFMIIGWLAASILPGIAIAQEGPVAESPDSDRPTPTVGMPARLEAVVLPGPELQAKPLENRADPIVLRVLETYPHGTAHRYDLEFYGLEPGTFDLTNYLKPVDPKAESLTLPPLLVEILPILPPEAFRPNPLKASGTPWLGGYRLALIGIGTAWVLGLVAILTLGRRRVGQASGVSESNAPATVADRLRPLVEAAMAGTLDADRRAELERTLITYWRERLDLEDLDAIEALAVLRSHEEAGPLLQRLEDWLHRPPGTVESVDLSALLEPYRDQTASSLERGGAGLDPAHA